MGRQKAFVQVTQKYWQGRFQKKSFKKKKKKKKKKKIGKKTRKKKKKNWQWKKLQLVVNSEKKIITSSFCTHIILIYKFPKPGSVYFGPLWGILGHFGVFWATLGYFGPLWGILGHFGVFWATSGYFGPLWGILGHLQKKCGILGHCPYI